MHLAPAGAVACRAMVTYLGLLLIARPLAGWRRAAIVPTVYLLVVAVLGRGDDIYHPAAWAWIAADGNDEAAWWMSMVVLAVGALGSLLLPSSPDSTADD